MSLHYTRFPLLVMLLLVPFLSGCGPDNSTGANSAAGTTTGKADTTTRKAGDASGFKVALITPSEVTDKGWGQSANDGINKVKTELGATVTPPVEKPGKAEVAGIMRNMAQDGNTIVFAHGSEYDDAAKQVATDFPKTTFVVMGGRSTGANLAPIQFASAQATYLAGMVAAGMTKTGKIGLVGPEEIPIIKESFAYFTKGAKTVRPDVQIKTTWTGSGNDTAKGKQQALALLDAGCDVIMHDADQAGLGVFQAVTEKPGAMVIGAISDQKELATSQNIGSFILDVPNAMLTAAQQIKDGKVSGKPVKVGLKEKAVGFVFNPAFKGTVPADLKAKVTKAEAAMVAGTLDPTK